MSVVELYSTPKTLKEFTSEQKLAAKGKGGEEEQREGRVSECE